jgi:hypothetical protein
MIERLVMFWAKFLQLLTVCLLRPRSQIKRDCCFSSVVLTLTRACTDSTVCITTTASLILAILDVVIALAMRQQNHSGDVAT